MIQYRNTWQNTACIARTIGNAAVCRTFMRSVFFITTMHGEGFIDRSPQIPTADLAYGIGGLRVIPTLQGRRGRCLRNFSADFGARRN
jgi:hypothetical protein